MSVIVPTRSEAANVGPFLDELGDAVTEAGAWGRRGVQVLFVDDSDDQTPHVIERQQNRLSVGQGGTGDRSMSVDLLHRAPDQRWGGLGGAVVDGMATASGSVVVVMDGDLQHPADRISDLLDKLNRDTAISIASRRIAGGHDGDGLTLPRRALSLACSAAARMFFPVRIGRVGDPLSGFFAVDLGRIDLNRLRPDGFKILVEVLATHPELGVDEIPFTFAGRLQGLSKASFSEGVRFAGHLIDVRIRQLKPWAGAVVGQLGPHRPQPQPARNG